MQAPRAADVGTKSVVTYFPNGRIGRVIGPLLFLAAFFGTLFLAVMTTRDVHLRCERATATCEIVTLWPTGASSSTSIPLASIRGTRLVMFRDKHSTSYALVLETTSGDVELSGATGPHDLRAEQKAQLDAFLAGDKSSPSVDIHYDEPSGQAFVIAPISLVWLLVAWGLAIYVRIEADWAARTLGVVSVRWPFAPKVRSFPLDAVASVHVEESRGRKGPVYRLMMDVEGQGRVPIGNASSDRDAKEGVATAVRALLARRNAGFSPPPT